MKVWIIDDNFSARALVKAQLEDLGYTDAQVFSNPVKAKTYIQGGLTPDLILLDWNMPQMSGVEFLVWLRKQGLQITVVMITAEQESFQEEAAMRLGATSFLKKPYHIDELEKVLEGIVKPDYRTAV